MHLLAYAGIALAWFHQIPTGNELVLDTVAADYWRALYVATLALLVGFRVVVPVVNAFRYRLRVAEVVEEGPGVVSLRITGRRLERLHARAGAVLPLALPHARPLGDGASVLALGGSRRAVAADHRQGARRPHGPARELPAGHARRRRRAVRRLHGFAAQRREQGRC